MAPLAIAKALLFATKTASDVLGNNPTPTAAVSFNKQQPPSGDKYNQQIPDQVGKGINNQMKAGMSKAKNKVKQVIKPKKKKQQEQSTQFS